jgi:colanic acid/amylovoran biosynthesis protein
LGNMSEKSDRPTFAAFAVSRTGNRGAVSMLESAIDHLTTDQYPGAFKVFTVYPEADRALPPTPQVELCNGTPQNLASRLIPLSILYRLLSLIGLARPGRLWGKDMQALLNADACLMIGGTTFSDAKLFKVPYNVACMLPAIILGKPSMMYSQTLGPFEKTFNRMCARWCLSRMEFIVPRGPGSLGNVKSLGLSIPAEYFTDSAFSLIVPDDVEQRIKEKYAPMLDGKTVVGISINTIVERECNRLGIDHSGVWAGFIEYLQRQGYFILFVPHSMRKASKSSHNNDLHATAEIIERLPSTENIHVVEEHYDCKELRVVVGLADYYMASRFHSMISALCTQTPVSVFGWGYQKYREVMEEFDLTGYCHDAADLSTGQLITSFERIVADAGTIKGRIEQNLPRVRQSSAKNHETAWALAANAE